MRKHHLNKCSVWTESWKGHWLTMASIILMVKAVIAAIPIYMLSCIEALVKVIHRLTRIQCKMVWDDPHDKKCIPLILWDTVMFYKVHVGIGIKDLWIQNCTLGAKLVWQVFKNSEAMWSKLLRAKYLDSMASERILTVANPHKGLAIYNFLLSCREVICDHLAWGIGDGKMA